GVEWNAMEVVNDFNVDYPLDFYRFFKEIGCDFIQFTPIVERTTADGALCSVGKQGVMTDFSIDGARWGRFLCTIFDEWVKKDIGKVFVQLFDATLANYMGVTPGLCTMAPQCGHAAVMEYNGDVYCCDHFVFPEYKLGNIHSQGLIEMMTSEKQKSFGRAKQSTLPRQCVECRWLRLCNGECPKNRFATTRSGEPGLNYLCEGYKAFFSHTAPFFELMKAELEAERAPANIMDSEPVRSLPEASQPWVD
ncbi:MAG: SPASM domain-containing protein, partial [Paramuribaculum sp.]|nr:SPASM domain-containing protein [Paramuribaculum sp.]